MVGSMYAAIAGLRAHQQKMNVIGNNLANVNTYGFKAQRVTFKESMYSTIRGSTAGTGTLGGTNAAQIGYGCSVGTIDMKMSSSTFAVTDNTLDVMIDGDGFFFAGAINPEGYSTSLEDNAVGGLQLTRVGNFGFDQNGYLTDGAGNVIYGFRQNADGQYNNQTMVPIRLPNVGGEFNDNIYDPNAPVPEDMRMALTSITISQKGEITGVAGDQVVKIGCIAMAYVDNPNGLTHMGGPYYQAIGNAGSVRAGSIGGVANNGNAANLVNFNSTLVPGTLEMSNVDVSNEFADLITTQRGFQANTKIITVTDEMLGDLVAMKR